MFSGLIPTTEAISWESHLMGFFAGVFCAVYYRKEPLLGTEGHEELIVSKDKDVGIGNENNTREEIIHYRYTFVPKKDETRTE